MIDNIVEQVRADLLDRSKKGIEKYGTTLDRDDLTEIEWMQHAYEEMLDGALYLKKLIELKKTKQMTAVEFLAKKYNYITWMRNRDEISESTADKWRDKYLKEAKKMEKKQLNKAWQEGAVTAQNDAAKEIQNNYSPKIRIELTE